MWGIMLLLGAVLNILVRNANPRGPMCFRCLTFGLLGPCELLFLLCFIAHWTWVVVSVMLCPCNVLCCCVVVYPLPWPSLVGGVRCSRLVVHQPASPSICLSSSAVTPAGFVHKSRGDNVVRMWEQLKRWCASCVSVLQRGHSGDGCDFTSILRKFDLRKGDLFVLSWAMVRRVRRGSISSELLMCGGGVRSILLLPLVAWCLEIKDVCKRRMFVFMCVVVTVWGSGECLLCSGRCYR